MSNIEKLQYVAKNKFHALDEITRLLIIIVADLEIEIKELKENLNKKSVNKDLDEMLELVTKDNLPKEEWVEKPKKKRGLFRK